MIMKRVTFYWLLVLWAFTIAGCGGKKADETKPISEIRAEAETMDAGQLRNIAVTYKEAIVAKTAEVEKITAKLKEIPVTELLGEQAKQLKANIDNMAKSIDALKARFDVYYAKLKEKSGDLSGLEL
jgi:alanyl-tRNA synthetase